MSGRSSSNRPDDLAVKGDHKTRRWTVAVHQPL